MLERFEVISDDGNGIHDDKISFYIHLLNNIYKAGNL